MSEKMQVLSVNSSAMAVLLVLVVWTLLASTQAQVPPCSAGLEGELPTQCFISQGIDYQGILYVISGNRTGAIPAGTTFSNFITLMCRQDKQDLVVPCILKLVQTWNRTSCTQQDRETMAARAGQILALMENVCIEPCEQTAMQTLSQCYMAVNIDPTSFFQNASVTSDKYSLIGNDSTSAQKICSARHQLFSCLGPISSTCPGFANRMYTMGVDLQAMEQATIVLCGDVNKYVSGIECFTRPSPAVTQCKQQADMNLKQVLQERFQTGITAPSKYMERLCQTRLSQVDCELKAFGQICDATLTKVRNTLECTILPTPCRQNPNFQPVFDSLCKTVSTPSPSDTVHPTQPPIIVKTVPGGSRIGSPAGGARSLFIAEGYMTVSTILAFTMSVSWL